jgi:4-hydroxybenzoate polyprenyltransferase
MICITNYIINEIVDAPTDAYHPIKHNRPVASGIVSIKILILIAIIFAMIAFLIANFFFSYRLILSLLTLLIMGFLYNIKPIRLKDIIYIDAISESANNPIRFLIGWYAVENTKNPSLALLLCWWAVGEFLMFGKRLSEKRILKETEAKYYRKSLGIYTESSLTKSMIISSIVFFLSCFYMILLNLNIYQAILLPISAIYIIWITLEAWRGKYLIDEPEIILKQPPFIILIIILITILLLSFA